MTEDHFVSFVKLRGSLVKLSATAKSQSCTKNLKVAQRIMSKELKTI